MKSDVKIFYGKACIGKSQNLFYKSIGLKLIHLAYIYIINL